MKRTFKAVPKWIFLSVGLAGMLLTIPIVFFAYLSSNVITTFVFAYLPIIIGLYTLITVINKLLNENQQLNSTIDSIRSQISILSTELETLKHFKGTDQIYEKRHTLFKEFIKSIGISQTPEEVLQTLSSFIEENFEAIKGFSVLIRGKNAITPAPLIRKGDTSPPQVKLEVPGRENIFYVHIGYIPGYVYSHELEDLMEIFNIALKKWEDLKGSITDPLTGAYNRQFLDIIKSYLESSSSEYTLLMIDLDGFKQVNDTMGHEKGDEILKNTVKRIESSLRGNDILIRYGGDEFIAIINDTTMENGLRVAERIRLSIRNNLISASIGAVYKRKGISANLEKLIKLADALMYIAKKEKDKVVGGKWEAK